MSIAFIPITAKSNLYNEEVVNNKWNSFLTNLSKSIECTTNININQDEFNSIIEKTLLKHYSIPSTSTPIKKEVKKEEKNDSSSEDEEEEKKIKSNTKIKKVEQKESKKKTEEKPRCKQILKNNEQCKGKSTKGGEYCTRHTPKKEESENDE